MKKPLLLLPSLILTSLMLANPALAHHPLDGTTPTTLWHGIISGFAHPILGLDHLAFIVAIGLLALFQKNRLILPASFVGASLLGCLLFLVNIVIPFNEMLIALSVICIGVALAYGRKLASHYVIILAITAGLAHGTAYGDGIIGAEATPLVAYLLSFTVGQFLIALMVGYIAEKILSIRIANNIVARLSGAVTLGIGMTYMVENVEMMAFGVI
ncbi:MAG: HupE/UreJ family protein [Alphaproteobacteria bacterium]|nr:HupE/UreJ family protein [Alphaproteobacteria bacterium]